MVKIDSAFVDYLRESDIVLSAGESEFFDSVAENLWGWLKEMSHEEVLSRLDECSETMEEIIDKGYAPIYETIGPLVFRNNFYVKPGKLILWFGGLGKRLTIDVEDIEEYLKVEKW